MNRIVLSVGMLWTVIMAFAQPQTLPWHERDRNNMEPLPYEYQREADVMWSKHIWRVIDVRQKMNLPFAYPQKPLIQIIHEAAKKGELTVYDPAVENADRFAQVMDRSAVTRTGETRDTVWQIPPDRPDGPEEQVTIYNPLQWERITKYRIHEIWFFDTKTSTMQVRILGLAPVMEDYDVNGNYRGDMTMYWVPYENLRPMLMKHEVFNARNDSQHYSWADLFDMRKFASYIYKESNVHDRNIQEYASGVDAQLESERIKQQIFEYEHDLWNY